MSNQVSSEMIGKVSFFDIVSYVGIRFILYVGTLPVLFLFSFDDYSRISGRHHGHDQCRGSQSMCMENEREVLTPSQTVAPAVAEESSSPNCSTQTSKTPASDASKLVSSSKSTATEANDGTPDTDLAIESEEDGSVPSPKKQPTKESKDKIQGATIGRQMFSMGAITPPPSKKRKYPKQESQTTTTNAMDKMITFMKFQAKFNDAITVRNSQGVSNTIDPTFSNMSLSIRRQHWTQVEGKSKMVPLLVGRLTNSSNHVLLYVTPVTQKPHQQHSPPS
jgi:hypothetical protein